MRRWKVSLYQKILGLALGIFAFAAVVYAAMRFRAAALENRDEARLLQIFLLEARQGEKDFLARKDTAALSKVETSLARLESLAGSSSGATKQDLLARSRSYGETFRALARDMRTRGLHENDGIEGKFRRQAHAVEEATERANLLQLLVDMHRLRRYEKNFINRGHEESITALRAIFALFKGDLEVSALPAAQKTELSARLADYLSGFEEFVTIMGAITKRVKDLESSSVAITPLIDEIVTEATARAAYYERLTNAAIGFASLIALAVAALLARRVIRPISELTETALRVADGDLEARASISTGDEIESLASSFNAMVDHARSSLAEARSASAAADRSAQKARAAEEEARAYHNALERGAQTLLEAMSAFARGNLVSRLPTDSNDILDKLFAGFNDAVANTRSLAANVVAAAEAVARAARQIASGAESMSAQAGAQQNQTRDIVEAVEAINEAIAENTRQTALAADESSRASETARQSGEVMSATIDNVGTIARVVLDSSDKIGALGESSAHISAIVSAIDEIADQTNLLALNAAIEAARAGDQGRGFAVVADEVRKLAERTQKATKEISAMTGLIQRNTHEAVQAMEQGKNLVRNSERFAAEASGALQTIIGKTELVAENIAGLASLSERQTAASGNIAANVGEMNDVARASATSVAELTRVAAELGTLTTALQTAVSRFVI